MNNKLGENEAADERYVCLYVYKKRLEISTIQRPDREMVACTFCIRIRSLLLSAPLLTRHALY